jgi:hypothetical protein
MRITLLIICCLFSFSVSAQWYKLDFKKHERYADIERTNINSITHIKIKPVLKPGKVQNIKLNRSQYSIEAAENIVMRDAQHNMRFRVYNDASYNFSALAKLYIQQNRYSEAKWYLLQSNIISRQQNDDKHTIDNLIALAMIKSDLGDFNQAQEDLTEARSMASMRGFTTDVATIEKKMDYIKLNKNNAPKTDVRYAENALINAKAE